MGNNRDELKKIDEDIKVVEAEQDRLAKKRSELDNNQKALQDLILNYKKTKTTYKGVNENYRNLRYKYQEVSDIIKKLYK